MKHLIALFLVVQAANSVASQPIFSSATEDSTVKKHWAAPNNTITHAVVGAIEADQKEIICDYLRDNKNIKNIKNLLSSTVVRLCNTCSETFYFVRPSSGRYSPLYGAHSYTFWLVRQDGKVVHSASVDNLDILDDSNNLLKPIEESNCLTSMCYITRLEFREGKYSPVSCRTYDVANDKMENNCDQ